MVNQVFQLPLPLREVHLLHSMRLFMRKAAMLAAYVDHRLYVSESVNVQVNLIYVLSVLALQFFIIS